MFIANVIVPGTYKVRPGLNLQGFPTDYHRRRGVENFAGLALVAPRMGLAGQDLNIPLNLYNALMDENTLKQEIFASVDVVVIC